MNFHFPPSHLRLLCLGNSSTPKLSTRDTFPGINRQNSDLLFGEAPNISAIHIAIDWDPTALHLRYQSTREKVDLWHEHFQMEFLFKKKYIFR